MVQDLEKPGTVESSFARKKPARSWWLMGTLMVGVFLSPLNVNFTSVALPTLRDWFGVGVEQATWVGTAYFIPSVVLMPFQASLGERWGIRRVYALGLFLLSLGGFLAATAPDFAWLLASRVLQGAGWSAIYPLALTLIRLNYAPSRQGEMMGIWESAVGLATIVSPVAAGLIVEFLGWPWLFAVLGLIAALGGLMGLAAIPQDASPAGGVRRQFDGPGALAFTLGLTLVLVGIARRHPVILILGGLAWFNWWRLARKSDAPFIPLKVFANASFVTASLAASLRMLIAIAALIALPLFFEDVQGLRPSLVGSLMVIYSLFLFLAAWPGGRWADAAGARLPGAVGFGAMIVGTVLLLGFDIRLSLPLVAAALAIRGIGAGLSQTPYAKAATDALHPEQRRLAAGLYGTIRYSGLALGTALVGIFLEARLNFYQAASGGPQASLPAYRQLWALLAILGLLGLVLTGLIGRGGGDGHLLPQEGLS